MRSNARAIRAMVLTAAACAALSSTGLAATSYTWNGTLASGTYDFNTASNWTRAGGPPGAASGDMFSFNNGSNTYTINSNTAPANAIRYLNTAKSTGTVTWNIGSAFNVQDAAAGDYSTFDLNSTTNINSGGTLTFGSGGALLGTARIIRGGDLNVNSGGTLNINASAATGFWVGNTSGTSTLDIASGGTLNFNSGLFRIGYNGGSGVLTSSGTVTSASGLRVAEGTATANGTVTVNAGTFTVNNGSTFGIAAGNTGTLNVSGGTYTQGNNSALNIGSSGVGVLNVSSGTLNVNTGSSGGQGRLTIGNSSTYNQTGGTVNVREFVSSINAQARQMFSGGSLAVNSGFSVNNGLIFRVGDGNSATAAALNLNNATVSLTPTGTGLYIATDGTLSGSGTAVNSGVRGNVNIDGVLTPGGVGLVGMFDIALGTQTNAGSILNFELGSGTTCDEWIGTAAFTFAGTLNVLALPGFDGGTAKTFDLFDFTVQNGSSTFSTVNLPSLAAWPSSSWDISDLYTTGEISIVVPEPASLGLLACGGLALLRRNRKR